MAGATAGATTGVGAGAVGVPAGVGGTTATGVAVGTAVGTGATGAEAALAAEPAAAAWNGIQEERSARCFEQIIKQRRALVRCLAGANRQGTSATLRHANLRLCAALMPSNREPVQRSRFVVVSRKAECSLVARHGLPLWQTTNHAYQTDTMAPHSDYRLSTDSCSCLWRVCLPTNPN